jgi:hypothetical protein
VSDSDTDDDEQCQNEAPTGSHLTHEFCRDKMERDGNRKDAEEWLKKPRSSPTSSQ